MSQLSRLIEQARQTRRVNDIFKIEPAVTPPQDDEPHADLLLARLAELERSLFANPAIKALPVDDLLRELADVAEEL